MCTYCNGKVEGEYVAYYADSVATCPHGGLEYSCYYVNDKRNGVARWYNPDGSLDSEQPHRKGQRDGVTARYYYKPDFDEPQVGQTLFVNDETLTDTINSADESLDRSQVDFYLEGSDPEFVAEFEYWRKVDPSWFLTERVIKRNTIVSHLNVGSKCEACYALLRSKVLSCGTLLPKQLPEDEQTVSVPLPSGCGAKRAEVGNKSFSHWEITVVHSDRIMTYDLSDGCNGAWLDITQCRVLKYLEPAGSILANAMYG